ncbi:MAG: hypothetical protein BHW30_01000 [Firmicutes bacterium CAG_194_44_15]|jgi:hypothetical protein|nr:MAG: hypothetical protein BHW30_01000 [Firmicutes bacterium CAG_194_44_15]
MNNSKTEKMVNFIFVLVFVGMIFLPFCLLDTTEIIDSSLENRRMTMWPGWHFNQEINAWYGHYVEDRVAFRETAVRFYMDATYAVFGEFSEDLHMYGKDGEVFPADDGYIRAYQHLATDEELIDSLVTYLDRTNQYLEKQGIPFVFLAGLDKKTVYGEEMPDYIHVDTTKESIMEMLARKLTEKQVPYVIPVQELRDAKQVERVYNQKYDSAHWNARGAMIGLRLLNEKVREMDPDVPLLTEDVFTASSEEKTLEFISLPITEQVPVYMLKSEYGDSILADGSLLDVLPHVAGTGIQHYLNENALSDKTILILQDSFLDGKQDFFAYRYQNVYMISRQNYESMQYYVETLKPDVVVFENAERAFVDDLYAYTNLANVTYE